MLYYQLSLFVGGEFKLSSEFTVGVDECLYLFCPLFIFMRRFSEMTVDDLLFLLLVLAMEL